MSHRKIKFAVLGLIVNLLVGCSDRNIAEQKINLKDGDISRYDEMWLELTKNNAASEGGVYSDEKIQIIVTKDLSNAMSSNLLAEFEWEFRVYFRNVGDKEIFVPLATGDYFKGEHRFPPFEDEHGKQVAEWDVFSSSYYSYNVKKSFSEYEFTRLLPGEVAVSRILYLELAHFGEVEATDKNSYLSITCDTKNSDYWNGEAEILLPVLPESGIELLRELSK